MNRQHMQKLVDDLNQDEEVENARVVEFMGNPHIHAMRKTCVAGQRVAGVSLSFQIVL